MENEPLISIIVPIYNVEKYLLRCVDSLIKQTYKNIEILLINDGSTDNCKKICEKLQEKYENIIAFDKKNGGLSDARNYGIKNAKGEYICFIDSDDYIDSKMVEILYNAIKETESDIAIVDYIMLEENEKAKNNEEINNKLIDYYVFNSKLAIKELFKENSFGNYAWNKLYKRSLFEEIKFPVGKMMEDLGTTYLLFDNSYKIVYKKIPLYYYIQRNGSILHNKNLQLDFDKTELALERYEYILKKYPDIEENKKFIYNLLIENYHIIFYNEELINKAKKIIKKFRISILSKLKLKNKIKYIMISLNEQMYINKRTKKGKRI